jgi:hypothetical protein
MMSVAPLSHDLDQTASIRGVDLWFLTTSAICLIGGVSLGIFMGLRHDYTFAPVHAHLNLLGWVSLALFALVYRTYPRLAEGHSARLHLFLCGSGAMLLPCGIALAVVYGSSGLAILASLLWLAGSLTFLLKVAVMLGRTLNLMR